MAVKAQAGNVVLVKIFPPGEAAVRAIEAGVDVLLIPPNPDAAIEAIAKQMAGVPGRKDLIWISAAFPLALNPTLTPEPLYVGGPAYRRSQRSFTSEVDRTTRALNAANIAVYPVDPRGIVLVPDEPPNPSPSGFATMELIAAQTGGVAFHDTNDIRGAISKALEDSEASYTLGFYPDSGRLDSSFHTLTRQSRNQTGMRVSSVQMRTQAGA